MGKRIWFLVGSFAGIAGLIAVGSAVSPETSARHMAPLMPVKAGLHTLTSTALSYCLTDVTSKCAWYAPGDLAVVKAKTGGSYCALSMTSSITVATTLVVTASAGADGAGSGFYLAAGERADFTVDPTQITVGSRAHDGICSLKVLSRSGRPLALGCVEDDDCAEQVSGSTCDTSLDSDQTRDLADNGAVTIVCNSDTHAAVIESRLEN